MNIKLALATLICSVAMSCSVSEGQLLDRMLSKAGCSVCETASPCQAGCSGGVLSGGGPGILKKITDRLAKVGCGDGCRAAADSCGCVEPVVESCGCDAAPACGGGAGLFDGLKDRFSSIGSGGCGCEAAPAIASCGGGPGLLDSMKARLSSIGSGCGCDAPAPVAAAPCGCDAGGRGLLDNLKGRLPSRPTLGGGGLLASAGGSGCKAPAPIASPCGAAGGPGLLDRLQSRMSSIGGGGGCGCDAAPVISDCVCSAPAPAPCVTPSIGSACGAAPAGGRVRDAVSGVLSRVGQSSGCGCGAAPAPVASGCGCSAGHSAGVAGGIGSRLPSLRGSSNLTLMDRLRGNRIPRDREGRVIGSGFNDGCNSPCPNMGGHDCGCGAAAPVVAAPAPCSSCSSCGSYEGSVLAAPAAGGIIYSDSPSSEGVITEAPISTESSPASEASDVIEKVQEVITPKVDATPAVDPNAFIIRNGNIRG